MSGVSKPHPILSITEILTVPQEQGRNKRVQFLQLFSGIFFNSAAASGPRSRNKSPYGDFRKKEGYTTEYQVIGLV